MTAMRQTMRILLLVLTLALASVGECFGANAQKAHGDQLRWNAITDQETPVATLNDGTGSYRLCPVRSQRISPSAESKTPPTHGRPFAAIYQNPLKPIVACRTFGAIAFGARPFASCSKSFIALRHILR